jgi:CDP-paratose 2-epimerase
LITGGCGFIGSNLAAHFLAKGWEVTAFDNFSRPGAEHNAAWLKTQADGRLRLVRGDVRDLPALRLAVEGADVIVHLAAQVAVTISVADPMQDFLINALGGIHVLEAARRSCSDPILLYASTNKVYGPMEQLRLHTGGLRHRLPEYPAGIPESFPVDLYSPYGCSKGSCDLYALDYARIYGLRTVVFRQSCIYGPRQFGVEDQGWLAHFVISALLGRPITIYGDGHQSRDVLHIRDLIDLYERAIDRIGTTQGQVYNVGGGPANELSLLELVYRLEARLNRAIPLRFGDWRPGDQRVYVSDVRKARRDLAWEPKVSIERGLDDLFTWVEANRELLGGQEREALASVGSAGQSADVHV